MTSNILPIDSPATWLKELGAVRPMAATGDNVLVLGEIYNGFYPICWKQTKDVQSWCTEQQKYVRRPIDDDWFLFGIPCCTLNRPAVERLLRHMSRVSMSYINHD